MKTYTLTEEQLQQVILKAFSKGENWGVTYSTWFTPDEDDSNAQFTDALNEVKELLTPRN